MGNPVSSLLGVATFLGGLGTVATQFGFTLGHTPNGKTGAEMAIAIGALITGLLWKSGKGGKPDPPLPSVTPNPGPPADPKPPIA